MDKAICGVPRCGYFRCGVTKPLFDDVVERLEKEIERSIFVSIEGFGSEGYEREGVLIPLFFNVLKRLEQV